MKDTPTRPELLNRTLSSGWRAGLGLLVAVGLLGWVTPAGARSFCPQEELDAELEALLEEEREMAEEDRRAGNVRRALRIFEEHLREDPDDLASRLGRARCRVDLGDLQGAREDLELTLEASSDRELRGELVRELVRIDLEQGEVRRAAERFAAAKTEIDPDDDPRDAWYAGRIAWLSGDQQRALSAWRSGSTTRANESDWTKLYARARCERRLGQLGRASRTLVEADRAAGGREVDILVELAGVYFEADGETGLAEAQSRSPGEILREAERLHPNHEGVLLGLFAIGEVNWRRQRQSGQELLSRLFVLRPNSIEGLLAGALSDLEDGQLQSARERLARLAELAPGRRERRTLQAALAWIEHRRAEAEATLAELADELPYDSTPERTLARTLCELYRFAEALPFAELAVERDPSDYQAWTQLARARANTGDEEGAREAFQRADTEARGRHDVWRNNMQLVLSRLESYAQESGGGQLEYLWQADAAEVLRTYWLPFYERAREELSQRYGFTPQDVRIEIFREHKDFSVRSTGFEGFPALGVCFGPVVTSLSPLSEMRGSFSWARTAFHEFTHVIHLGLSHNRCPRWITEGLATWEEAQVNPAWQRNMRRELVDAVANDDLIPVRELNRAFRGPRILFGYFQGGLLCEMLIAEHGFTPLVGLLEAFDRGLDLDQALAEVFGKTPEQVDAEFRVFCEQKVAQLHIEPNWSPTQLARLSLELAREAPQDELQRARWAEDWTTVARGAWQDRRRIDAEQALRRVKQAGAEPPRALFLRGELAFANGEDELANEFWLAGLDAGGRDYRVSMALGAQALAEEAFSEAEVHYLSAEEDFPGFDDGPSAELQLARLYSAQGRVDDMMLARERWLRFDAGEYDLRLAVAAWHASEDRHIEAQRLYAEANEVDPFRRNHHRLWAQELDALARYEEAAREYRTARVVPIELDLDAPAPYSKQELAELLGLEARAWQRAGEQAKALQAAQDALELDEDAELALEVVETLQ